ncbi:MAG: alpha-galactosidase [Bacteroidetes bacterium]|nr:alpha-galactosidase [Bacteroidota bacterium]
MIGSKKILEYLLASALFLVTNLFLAFGQKREGGNRFLANLKKAPAGVILSNGTSATTAISVERKWDGYHCQLSVKNNSALPLSIREVIVFDLLHQLPDTTKVYGEGFQKLAQVGGTLAKPEDWGSYADRSHYKITEPDGLRTAYGMFMLEMQNNIRVILATTSCNKFISRFSFNEKRLRISIDCENLTLQPGKSWNLEDFIAISGTDREKLFELLSQEIARHHPRLKHDPVPMGWCSWYCFGPKVTAKNITDNINWISANLPALKYIQIDDGYQPWMGDWLERGNAFDGDVTQVMNEIKAKGLEPAIWVAPFIASPESKLFKNHPDWFVKDKEGNPLRSDKVGFGGWRLGPWYVLDGTHPQVQQFLTELFRTMREKWGCRYFKLDALYWGAIHGAVHYDKEATRIEAYRRGMQAILQGAGDAFILGCNHPIWASLGLINGSRSSMDISNNWESFRKIGRENLLRAWQNGRLWWNDPDCILLTDKETADITDAAGNKSNDQNQSKRLTENEFLFHATIIYASGGLLLSGDDLTKISHSRLQILKKLIPPTGKAAKFENEKFEVGSTTLANETVYSVFNWDDEPVDRMIKLPVGKCQLSNKWTDVNLGVFEKFYTIKALPPHTAVLIVSRKIKI